VAAPDWGFIAFSFVLVGESNFSAFSWSSIPRFEQQGYLRLLAIPRFNSALAQFEHPLEEGPTTPSSCLVFAVFKTPAIGGDVPHSFPIYLLALTMLFDILF